MAAARPSVHLLGWASTCLWIAYPLALTMNAWTPQGNPVLGRRLPVLGLFALLAASLMVLVFPVEVLFLLPSDLYPAVQVAGLGGGVWAAVTLWREFRDKNARTPVSPRLLDAIIENGRLPRGERRRGQRKLASRLRSLMPRGVPLVRRVQVAVVHRCAVMLRLAALAVIVVVAASVQLTLTGWTFIEGWVALLLMLVLRAEALMLRWRQEDFITGFSEPDPTVGRGIDDAWWGVTAALMLAATLRTSAVMGGLRPEPWAWYAVLMALALLAGVLPYPWAASRSEWVFATWLRWMPSRLVELTALRDGWPRDRTTFGELPR